MKNNYIVLYSDKKREDNIMIKSMFSNTIKIDVCWTDSDCDKYIKLIDKYIKEKELKQIIFAGFELGWDKLIQYIKSNYSNIIVKVIWSRELIISISISKYSRTETTRSRLPICSA